MCFRGEGAQTDSLAMGILWTGDSEYLANYPKTAKFCSSNCLFSLRSTTTVQHQNCGSHGKNLELCLTFDYTT